MFTTVDINSMDNDYLCFAYNLDFVKENSRSIYAEGYYGDIYRIEKSTKKVYRNGKKIADFCEYFCF